MGRQALDRSQLLECGSQLRRAAIPRGVRVAAEHVDQPRLGQSEHPRRRLLAQEEIRGGLDQGAGGNQTLQALEHVRRDVTLGMGDQRAVAALGKVLNAAGEAVGERPGRRLEQDPASAAQPHQRQLLRAQALDCGLCDLAALKDGDWNALRAQPLPKGFEAAGDPLDVDIVVVADVRGGADRHDPVRGRLPGHPGAVSQV